MSEAAVPPENDDASTDCASDSSSLVYDHEPFETFRVKVLALARQLWNDCTENSLDIERMSGGGCNRVIGITHQSSDRTQKKQEYVLRIPRFDAAQLDQDVAALHAVRKLGQIPIPDVFAFDETNDNPLGDPYMVQYRLPGVPLLSGFPGLTFERNCFVAATLGSVISRMSGAEYPCAGKFSFSAVKARPRSCAGQVVITPFFDPEETATRPSSPPQLRTLDMLSTAFNNRTQDGQRKFPLDDLRPQLQAQFITMAQELDKISFFNGVHYSPCHLDFAPRNIMLLPDADSAETIISAVLDWDSAVSAPSFMACAPPLWA